MEHHVLKVDRQIEQQHRDDDRDPDRHIEIVEQAPATILGHDGQTDREDRERQPQDDCVDHHERKIIGPADHPRDIPSAPGGCHFPQRHRCQNTQKDDKTDGRLSGKDGLGHGSLALGLVGRAGIAIIQVIA